MVARCGGPMRFFGIVDLICMNNSRNGPKGRLADIADNLRRIGRTAGLTNDQLDACLTNQPMAEALLGDLRGEHGGARHQSGTPTLVINDVMHSNMSYADLSALLDEALAEAE
jgi:hypothetical protein